MSAGATTAGQALCDVLARAGVDCVFGVPGTQNVELFEVLRRRGLRTVLTTHELGAAFMANGYARASGRPGVVVAIPGPGFTYTLTGLAEARLDSTPLVLLTGRPATAPGAAFQLQAIDQARIAAPLVKEVIEVSHSPDLAPCIAAALATAQRGEPGPVMVQFDAALVDGNAPSRPDLISVVPTTGPADQAKTREAITLLAAARRPVILAGQGALGAAAELRVLVERLDAPLVTTPSGRGVLPETHPLVMGFDALRGGLAAVNELMAAADCVLVLGAKLGHNGTGGFALRLPADRLIHVDADPGVLGANYPARLAIESTVEAFLAAAAAVSPSRAGPADRWSPDALGSWRERCRSELPTDPPEPALRGVDDSSVAAFFAALRRALPPEGMLVADSGLHQTLARRHFDVLAPRGLLLPSDFQSMGFGVPAAIGAKLAAPQRAVAAVVGDGGFLMSGMELVTAVRERVAVTIVVFNDGQLNLIRLQQLRDFGRAHAVALATPDLAAFAGAIGAAYVRVGGGVEDSLRDALGRPGPVLVEVEVGDSVAVRAMRARSLARATVRRALGQRLLGWLKRLPRR